MNVEIAICTWNRARFLRQTLDSIAAATVPPDICLRVIVVNNNSTDSTAEVIVSFRDKLELDGFDEPQPGHSISRNCAIRQARGDLLIWTDDDVIVDPDWLVAYADAARRDQDKSFWGGPIVPVFESGEPKWIRDNWDKLSGCFAARDLGPDRVSLTHQQLPYGANFAVRTDVQKKFLFDVSFGRNPTEVQGEDELHLTRRLLDAGHGGVWIPAARLKHVIEASRTTEGYVRRYFVGQGQALVAKGETWSDDASDLLREARWETACYRAKRLFTSSDTWLSHLIRGALAEGQCRALSAN